MKFKSSNLRLFVKALFDLVMYVTCLISIIVLISACQQLSSSSIDAVDKSHKPTITNTIPITHEMILLSPSATKNLSNMIIATSQPPEVSTLLPISVTMSLSQPIIISATKIPEISTISTSDKYEGTIYYKSQGNLWKTKLSDKTALLLATEASFPLALSPNQEWISYMSSIRTDEKENDVLWIANTDDSDMKQVSQSPLIQATWLTDNTLFYNEYPDFSISHDGTERNIGKSAKYIFHPLTGHSSDAPSLPQLLTEQPDCRVWLNPTGKEDIAQYCEDDSGNNVLRITSLDGSNPITLTTAYKTGVQWSVDGNSLLFGAQKNEEYHLFVWNRSDNNVQQVTEEGQDSSEFIAPSWSPDKQWVAYYSGGNDFCVLRIENSSEMCFGDYVSSVGNLLSWSPDSQALVLSSNRIGQLLFGEADLKWDLFIVGIPDGDVVRVTDSQVIEAWPIWGD